MLGSTCVEIRHDTISATLIGFIINEIRNNLSNNIDKSRYLKGSYFILLRIKFTTIMRVSISLNLMAGLLPKTETCMFITKNINLILPFKNIQPRIDNYIKGLQS
jgi:hypothetical protein